MKFLMNMVFAAIFLIACLLWFWITAILMLIASQGDDQALELFDGMYIHGGQSWRFIPIFIWMVLTLAVPAWLQEKSEEEES